jgi:hypothetical protein
VTFWTEPKLERNNHHSRLHSKSNINDDIVMFVKSVSLVAYAAGSLAASSSGPIVFEPSGQWYVWRKSLAQETHNDTGTEMKESGHPFQSIWARLVKQSTFCQIHTGTPW